MAVWRNRLEGKCLWLQCLLGINNQSEALSARRSTQALNAHNILCNLCDIQALGQLGIGQVDNNPRRLIQREVFVFNSGRRVENNAR